MSTHLELHTDVHQPGKLVVSSDNINTHAPSYRVIIKDPQAPSSLATQLTSSPSTITTTTAQDNPIPMSISTSSLKTLKIHILAPIKAETPLTPTELNGGTDGPVTSSFTKAWRDAFRRILAQHCIEHVQFGIRCERDLEPRHIGKLLQEVSAGLYLKTKMEMGREVRFEAVGRGSVAKKTWLEGCFPGRRE